MQKQCYNCLLWLLNGLSLHVEELYLEVIMDFKSFLIVFVVGMFGPYMDDVIRKIFSKFSKKNTDSTP